MGAPAVFLDRDGVINRNRPDYVRSWSEIEIYPQALKALQELASASFVVVVVTNQSPVGRGLMPREEMDRINARLVEAVRAAGGRIDAVYACPHAPEDGCACRKPAPGMILQAAAEHDIDLGRSILIGDAVTDLQAAAAAGIPTYALVRTGRGLKQEKLLRGKGLGEAGVFEDLKAALENLLKVEG